MTMKNKLAPISKDLETVVALLVELFAFLIDLATFGAGDFAMHRFPVFISMDVLYYI